MPPKRKRDKLSETSLLHEYKFEPVLLSDITVHYGDACYHLHKFHLATGSSHFEALIIPDAETPKCDLTDRCQRSGHRCITLSPDDDTIGGLQISHEQIELFLSRILLLW